jgi:hypothetical protein
MPILFPTSPTVGQVFTSGGRSWVWTGATWDSPSSTNPPLAIPTGNILINGAFEINQRAYVSGTNLNGTYGFDRWKSTGDVVNLTFTAAPQGQLVTLNEGGRIEQVVERQNIRPGVYTLSWQGTATGRVYNAGSTAPAYAASPITLTLDGLANVEVEFTASVGTRTLGFVQLEASPVATPFRRNGSTLQAELAACQRYFVRLIDPAGAGVGTGGTSGGASRVSVVLPVEMRANPSISASGTFDFWNGAYTRTGTWLTNQWFTTRTAIDIEFNLNASFAASDAVKMYLATNASQKFIDVSAEL